MIDKNFAKRFAAEWMAAWNAHNLDAILLHYDEDFEMSSPVIVQLQANPTGILRGKSAVRDYWRTTVSH